MQLAHFYKKTLNADQIIYLFDDTEVKQNVYIGANNSNCRKYFLCLQKINAFTLSKENLV